MKQVSRSGEGTGELARLDGVKTGAQMGGQKIVAIIVVAQGRTVLVKLPLGGVWSIANRDEVTIQARQQGRVKGVYRIANRIVACIRVDFHRSQPALSELTADLLKVSCRLPCDGSTMNIGS